MDRTTIVTVDDHGAPVVRHVAGPGPAADELRHEAIVLDRARGLGVVDLVEAVDEPGGGAAVATRFVPGGTIADVARDHGERAALGVLCRVAGILADLHRAGIVHGRCAADHVLGGGQEVALCGLRAARLRTDGRPLETAADTDGFAALVLEVCSDDTDLCRRARRAVSGLVGPAPTTNLRVVAAELADLAGVELAEVGHLGDTGATPSPTARVIGSHRARTIPGAEALHGRIGHTSPARRAVAGAAVAVGIGLMGGLALRSPSSSDGSTQGATEVVGRSTTTTAAPVDDAPPDAAPGRRAAAQTDEPVISPPVQVWPTPSDEGRTPATTPPHPAVGVAGVVEHEGVRYQVGGAGDLVVVGDWDCDGLVTPSLVRPGDGSVWTFATWAAGGEVVVARSLGFAPSPVAAAVVPAGDGCDAISVTTADGRQVLIEPA